MLKANEYPAEIQRVKKIISTTNSKYLKKDMEKCLRRLTKELAEYKRLKPCKVVLYATVL